ncbi:MAG: hypothetical protein ACUVR3_02045, partial [Candidatus Roseilinea sp.]|uniref:hypothetical protein n=1 Tax=Candidatus Roseilinea sp. TaxID=2838777 RepID=UPI00404A7829
GIGVDAGTVWIGRSDSVASRTGRGVSPEAALDAEEGGRAASEQPAAAKTQAIKAEAGVCLRSAPRTGQGE